MTERPSAELLLDALRPLVADLVEPLERRIDELEQRLAGSERRKWLTLEEAGERLGCSAAAVRMRARRGRLNMRHHGRRVYVSADSVDSL